MSIPIEEILWNQNLFRSLRDGGMWAVPRSGLIFTKAGKEMHLTAKMPWSEEIAQAAKDGFDVPPNKEAFESFQQNDYECIASRFRAGGIPVVDRTKPGSNAPDEQKTE